MPREWQLRLAGVIALLGILLGLVLLFRGPNDSQAGVLRQSASQVLAAEQARAAATMALEGARTRMRAAEGDAKQATSRASAARARVSILGAHDVIVSTAPSVVPLDVPVPVEVTEGLRLDSAAITSLATLVHWKDTVIVRQDQRITADSLELAATTHAFVTLQRIKEPRCGRRCGVVLGVGGVLAAALTIEQVRRVFR